MTKTKTKKTIAVAAVSALTATSLMGFAGNNAFATQIGTGTIVGSGTTSVINWNDTFTASAASGSITGIKVKARILPTLNMEVSAQEIDLGTLVAWLESNGTVDLEVGTNAANGVVISARSDNAGLTNLSNPSVKIHNDGVGSTTTDGIVDSYTFASTNGTSDSDITGYDNTLANLAATQVNNSDENTIYQTNKPEKIDATNADVTFTVAANPNAQTAAGDYEDFVTFTVTGNF